MRAGWRRAVLWGAIGVLVAAGLAYSFRPRPVPVDLMELSRGPLVVTVDEEGETRVRDVFLVSAPVAGTTRRIEAEVGDRVIAHETTIVELRPTEPSFLDVRSRAQAEAAVRAAESATALAEAELERAEADLDFARPEMERARELFRKGTISQRELDEAERAYRSALAARDRARAGLQVQAFELERARAQLLSPSEAFESRSADRFVPIRAPVSGVILRIPNKSERVVMAGEPLAEIGDPRDLEVVVDLLSADAVKVSVGDRVWVEAWGGGEALEGRVRRVEPFGFTKISALGIEEQRVNVIVDLTTPQERWQRLGHGYQVEARIVLWEGDDVLKLPLTALFRDGEGDWAVFVANNGRAERRRVEVGRRTGLEAQIVGGLSEGERVVVHPSDRVADGVSIAARG